MQWSVKREDLKADSRIPGVSGFMRLRNEAQFLRAAVDSHLPHLDELILVYNNCDDDTPAICEDYAARFPGKVRAIHYRPFVFPAGSPEYLNGDIPDDAEESLANYYNFSLCQTTRKIAVKIDGDHIALSSQFGDLCARVREKMPRGEAWSFRGLNFLPRKKKAFLWARFPATAGETSFFYVAPRRWHYYHETMGWGCEVINMQGLRIRNCGIRFLHLHWLKDNFGYANYLGKGNKMHKALEEVRSDIESGTMMTVGQFRILRRKWFQRAKLPARIEDFLEDNLRAHGIYLKIAKTSVRNLLRAWSAKLRRIKFVTVKSETYKFQQPKTHA